MSLHAATRADSVPPVPVADPGGCFGRVGQRKAVQVVCDNSVVRGDDITCRWLGAGCARGSVTSGETTMIWMFLLAVVPG